MYRRKVWSVVAILLVLGSMIFFAGAPAPTDELSGNDTCKWKTDFVV